DAGGATEAAPPTCVSFLAGLIGRPGGTLVHVGRAAAAARPVAGARPRRPEDHREDDADDSHDQQDPADRVDVHARDVVRDRECEDRAEGGEEDANSETHMCPSPFVRESTLCRGVRAVTEKALRRLRAGCASDGPPSSISSRLTRGCAGARSSRCSESAWWRVESPPPWRCSSR